ncbi:MAG: phoU [Clostridiales bacterium]|jgi:phosphate transport system protein|nr:phoU [Clostridiales bacterium]
MTRRASFESQLEELNNELVRMGNLVEKRIEQSVMALENRDKVLAKEIIMNDNDVDEMEKSIEQRCITLLLRQQPVATDLRAISTALKIITDMERIGDQAADIADLSLHFDGSDLIEIATHLTPMAKAAIAMVHSSIDAFIRSDLTLAEETIVDDDIVDNLFLKVRMDVIEYLSKSPAKAEQAIDIMMIAKYLERIGDHATNICEWVTLYVTGEHKKTRIF